MNAEPLPPYTAAWTWADAAHLLRRVQSGATLAEIDAAHARGLTATLDLLFTPPVESAEFLAAEPILFQTAIDTGSIDDLKAWWLYRLRYTADPLTEKLALFWHNHFATSFVKVQSVRLMAEQNALFRQHALGSFADLLKAVARDPAMLLWLDGNANRKRQPNENFAREVMELFSLDVGHYTERDIQEAARAFTGWHVRAEQFWFNRQQHDFGEKTVLGQTGNLDGDDIIQICLAQPACPEFLARKLLRTFVTGQPTNEDVTRLAARLREHDLHLRPVLRELLGSDLFFQPAMRQALIKSPLDLVIGTSRTLGHRPHLPNLARAAAELGQDLFQPPSVKGWDGGRLWINSHTLLQRANFAVELLSSKRFGTPPDLSAAIGDATDAVTLTRTLLGAEISPELQTQVETLAKNATGDRQDRLQAVALAVTNLPEFQLM